ncbi:TonB-dependent siderophore receptor [Sphingomonas sp. S6]|jgi:iron complex outermembrane receptor protein|uniref:TonB-dependent receptor plug domain-containing protein n=1 Tax=Sphingomonas sp. S6 TaxID=3368600 RepID=UPI000FB5E443|nr:TonB-dependent receptor [uncultured Sphingomonas sp.]RTL23456.1 MAG: TonB-dependent receptor [Sphingomonadaceae bacterium]
MNFDSTTSRTAIAVTLFIVSTSVAEAQTTQSASALVLTPVAASIATDPVVDGQQALVSDAAQQDGSDIIVTGTRATGITAAESAAPIKVLDSDTLSHVGQPNLNQVLTQLVPSFTAQAFGGDTANLTLSARLRGLSPNHTLVLVNGKRRHGTANLAVLGGPYQGAATADLDLISPSSIKRIEVLEDGAAAQYGSDAIAGVINIILKDDKEGGDGYVTAGQNYDVGGETYAGTLHLATKVGESGYFNVTAFHRYHDFTRVGGLDRRVTDASGTLLPLSTPTTYGISAIQRQLYPGIAGFPYVNAINGDAQSRLTNLQYNTAYDFGDGEVYSFGTYSKRIASANENVRVPTRVSRTVAGVTTYFDPEGNNPANGFIPREKIREDDMAFTGGVRGMLSGFHYDLSTTFGQDKNEIYTVNSANASLFADTGFTPTSFYDGFFKSTEFTVNADFTHEIDAGLAGPINLAFGAEYRKNVYQIGSGDPGSIYKEGGQSYPGFRPSDAGINGRNSQAAYVDIAVDAIEGLKLDVAGRYEHYSDFGSKFIYKGTGRYDFSDAFALRGTFSTGFRAPTLAESYYSATNVSPTSAFVQLPANSAAAKLIGFQNLKPEKSTNYSLGTVIRPIDRLTITLDAYQVKIRDRILGTGSIFGSGGAVNFPIVTRAIVANGNVLDPTVSQTGINIFTNGADTRTRGVDLVVSYATDFGDYGKANWTISGNYNETKLTNLIAAPATLTNPRTGTVIPLFDLGAQANIETASPRVKVISSVLYTLDKFSATLRGTVYGKSSAQLTPDGGTYYKQTIGTAFIGDIELNYDISPELQLTVGANNVFNKRPPTVPLVPGTTNLTLVNGGNVLDAPLTFSPYGINGGYYYARINVSF